MVRVLETTSASPRFIVAEVALIVRLLNNFPAVVSVFVEVAPRVTVPPRDWKVEVERAVQLPKTERPKFPVEEASNVPAFNTRSPLTEVVAPSIKVSAVPSVEETVRFE